MKRLIYTALVICAASGVSQARPPMTDEEWSSYEGSEAQFTLQRFGADPETAKWGVWAMKHQRSSRCALEASRAFHAMRGLYSGGGESMVVDHICEPEALKYDALTIPPFSPDEAENERLQWGVTSDARNKAIAGIVERQKQAAREARKRLRPPAYLTSPNSKNFVDQCRFIRVEFPETAQQEGRDGHVDATCHFQKGNDNYWRADSCHFSAPKGTGDDIIQSARDFVTAKCWPPEDFDIKLNSSGIGTAGVDFTLGDE